MHLGQYWVKPNSILSLSQAELEPPYYSWMATPDRFFTLVVYNRTSDQYHHVEVNIYGQPKPGLTHHGFLDFPRGHKLVESQPLTVVDPASITYYETRLFLQNFKVDPAQSDWTPLAIETELNKMKLLNTFNFGLQQDS